MAKPIQSFLKILKKLFFKKFLKRVQGRALRILCVKEKAT